MACLQVGICIRYNQELLLQTMHRPDIAVLLFLHSAHLLLRFYSMTASLGGFARSPDRTLPLSGVSRGPCSYSGAWVLWLLLC